jgi:hypothetical protein
MKHFIELATLKKAYSISCKDYVVLGIMNSKFTVVDLGSQTILGQFECINRANEVYDYFVNKI